MDLLPPHQHGRWSHLTLESKASALDELFLRMWSQELERRKQDSCHLDCNIFSCNLCSTPFIRVKASCCISSNSYALTGILAHFEKWNVSLQIKPKFVNHPSWSNKLKAREDSQALLRNFKCRLLHCHTTKCRLPWNSGGANVSTLLHMSWTILETAKSL